MLINIAIKCKRRYIKFFFIVFAVLITSAVIFCGNQFSPPKYNTFIKTAQSNEIAEEKIAFLTFDDGPSAVTDIILDHLKVANVKATFFVVGKTDAGKAERDRLFKRIVDEGHQIGLHTYSHDNYKEIYLSAQFYVDSILNLQNEIQESTGYKTNIFRFPGGSNNRFCPKSRYLEIVKKTSALAMQFYDWNVDAKDAIGHKKNAKALISSVVSDSKKLNYPVILMHDIIQTSTSAEAIPEIIMQLKKAGYIFDTVDKLAIPVHQMVK